MGKGFVRLLALLLTLSAARATELTGSVLDPAGKPAAGVQVALAGVVVAEAEGLTDAQGRFTLEGTPTSMTCVVAGGEPGIGWAWVKPAADAPAADSPVIHFAAPLTINLSAWRTAEGRLRDEAGQPVVGAMVELRELWLTGGGGPLASATLPASLRATATTDGDGRWRLPHWPPDGADVWPTHPDWALSPIGKQSGQGGDLRCRRRPATAVVGRVIDTAGQPVVGVTVSAGRADTAVTDAAGRYRLCGLRAEQVSLRLADDAPMVAREVKQVTAVAEQTVDAGDLVTERGVLLTLRAVDSVTGQPIAGLQLDTSGRRTDAQGSLAFRRLPGHFSIYFEPERPYFWPELMRQIDGQALTDQTITCRLERGRPLSGTVIDEAGRPVTDALIEARSMNDIDSARTDAQGRFLLRCAPPRVDAQVTVARQGQEPLWRQTLDLKARGDQPLAIALQPLPRTALTGRVVDRQGRPLAAVDISLVAGPTVDAYTVSSAAQSGADGRFRIDGDRAPRTEWRFVLSAGRPQWTWQQARGRALGAELDLGDLTIEPLDAELAGQVLKADGAPAAGALVRLMSQFREARYVYARTDPTGRFTFRGVQQAAQPVIAGLADAYGEARLTPGGQNLLRLRRIALATDDQAADAALDLLRTLWREMLASHDIAAREWAEPMARLDADEALQLLSELPAADDKMAWPMESGLAVLLASLPSQPEHAPRRAAEALRLAQRLPAPAQSRLRLVAALALADSGAVDAAVALGATESPAGARPAQRAAAALLSYRLGRPEALATLREAVAAAPLAERRWQPALAWFAGDEPEPLATLTAGLDPAGSLAMATRLARDAASARRRPRPPTLPLTDQQMANHAWWPTAAELAPDQLRARLAKPSPTLSQCSQRSSGFFLMRAVTVVAPE